MKSGKLSDRERAILSHVARYRLGFQEILRILFFDGKSPQKDLDHLRKEGYLTAAKGLEGNRSAYELTPRGARTAGLGRERGRPSGSDAAGVNLALIAFCFLKGQPRIRVEYDELREVFGNRKLPGRYYCLEHTSKAKRVYHVYVPGETTPPPDIAGLTAEHVERALALSWLRPWLDNDVFSHAILVDTPERGAEVEVAIGEQEVKNHGRLRQLTHIHVEVVPGVTGLEEALRALA